MPAALRLTPTLLAGLGMLSPALVSARTPPCPEAVQNEAGWRALRDADLASARATFSEVLAVCPDDVDATVGLAYVELRADRLAQARLLLERALLLDPTHGDARKGLARLEGRSGRIAASERHWRTVLEQQPDDVEALVGRARVLRWQGDPWAAQPLLQRALALDPADNAAREEAGWNRATLGATVQGRITHEGDSDDNHVTTFSLGGALPVNARIRLGWQSYLRSTSFGIDRDRRAAAYHLTSAVTLPSGWRLRGGVGANETSVLGQAVAADFDVAVATPVATPLQLTVRLARSPRHYTSTLIERGVHADEAGLDAAWTSGVWSLATTSSLARYRGTESNRQWTVGTRVRRTFGERWESGVIARGFGFSEDLRDGYFDPSHFLLAEIPVATSRTTGPWRGRLEGAVGAQASALQDGVSFAPRVALDAGYRLAPGREIVLTGVWTRSDALRLSGGRGSYRYTSIGVAGSWVF
ncbi:MAG: tetratricopeptide repeat protein [Gemmatimonadota bacterium]